MTDYLEVGDTVKWSGSWGQAKTQLATVKRIEACCEGRYGTEVNRIPWHKVIDRRTVIDLTNGSWAYGNQIEKQEINQPTTKGA